MTKFTTLSSSIVASMVLCGTEGPTGTDWIPYVTWECPVGTSGRYAYVYFEYPTIDPVVSEARIYVGPSREYGMKGAFHIPRNRHVAHTLWHIHIYTYQVICMVVFGRVYVLKCICVFRLKSLPLCFDMLHLYRYILFNYPIHAGTVTLLSDYHSNSGS